jgi:tetratricopeptide (TPR) repeat protein
MRQALLGSIFLLAAVVLAQSPEEQLTQAVKLHRAGDLEGAERGYQAVLKVQPDNIVARSNLGAVYAHQGRYQEAIGQYTLALAADSENPGIRFNLGLAYYDSAQIAKAAPEFGNVLAAQPDNDRAALLLADCYLRMGENKKAIELLGPREATHQNDRAFLYVLGTALIRENQAQKGQQLIDRILREGDSAQAHIMLGSASMMGRDYKKAAGEFARAVELDPKLPSAHGLYGRAVMATGDLPKAMDAFRAELAVDPGDFDSNLYLGVLLKKDQKFEEALPYLKRALESRPEAPEARYQLGSLHVSTGDIAQAQTILEELVRDAPDFVEAHVSLATVYYRLKRKQDGDREQEIVRKLNADIQARPTSAEAAKSAEPEPKETFETLSRRADAAREADRADEAIDLYQKALDLKSDWTEGWWYLGTLFYEKDRYAEASSAFARVSELKPKGGPGWAMLGLCEFQLKQYDQALDHLQRGRALGLVRDSHLTAVTRYHTAILLNWSGESEAALQILYAMARDEQESDAVVAALGITALRMHILPAALTEDKRGIVMKAGRAEYLAGQRHVAEAARRFDELAAAYPAEPGVHYARGVFLLASDADKALEEFRKELEISPQHVNARLQIAFEYIKRADYTAGRPYAEQAVKLDPSAFAARNALGRILLELGQTTRAIEELETGLKLAPDSPETCYALARAYTRAGRKQEANRARAEFNRLDKLRRGLREGQAAGSPAADSRVPPPG